MDKINVFQPETFMDFRRETAKVSSVAMAVILPVHLVPAKTLHCPTCP
jgi:hypothetical protein